MEGRVVTFLCVFFHCYSARFSGKRSDQFKPLNLKEKNTFMIFVCDINRSASIDCIIDCACKVRTKLMQPNSLHEVVTVAATDAGILSKGKGMHIPDIANECGGNGEWKLASQGVL